MDAAGAFVNDSVGKGGVGEKPFEGCASTGPAEEKSTQETDTSTTKDREASGPPSKGAVLQ